MAYERKPNSGSLWDEKKENISKRTGQKYEYYTGDALMECPKCHHVFEMWITAFYNIVKTGKRVFNLSFMEKKPRVSEGSEYPPRVEQKPDELGIDISDIPF